ncbi:MAG TPA: hypothetical protein VEX35_10100 [Allosphingosinicella sp.]|nr:hypothetical protein [Allosphingosinicella sp.]
MAGFLKYMGLIGIFVGLIFMAQGGGILPWPAGSFMVGSVHWVFYGGILLVVGIGLYMASRYIRE